MSRAEGTDPAVPAAPWADTPVPPAPPRSPAKEKEDEQNKQEHPNRVREVSSAWRSARHHYRGRHVLQLHTAPLGDAADDACRPGKKAAAVLSLAKLRQDRFSNRFPGEAVGDEPFKAVSDLDPDFAILDRDDDQEPVVLPTLADAPPLVLEHLDSVFADVGVRLKRRHGGDHDDVAAGAVQGLDAPIKLSLARIVDDPGEVVDRAGQHRWRGLRTRVAGDQRQEDQRARSQADHSRHPST